MTYEELVKEIKNRHRKAVFEYQEVSGEGDIAATNWCESRMKTLEGLLIYIEDDGAKQKYSKVLKKKGKK